VPDSALLLSPEALWIGRHALAILLATLGLLPVAMAAIGRALRQYAVRRRQAAPIPGLPQLLRTIVGAGRTAKHVTGSDQPGSPVWR
jgi:hypothetical protein